MATLGFSALSLLFQFVERGVQALREYRPTAPHRNPLRLADACGLALPRPCARRRRARRSRARPTGCRAGISNGGIRPVERLARARHFFRAQRLAMRLCGAGACRRAKADGGAAGDQHRPVARLRFQQRGATSSASCPSTRWRAQPDASKRFGVSVESESDGRRRWRCRCRRTGRSDG